MTTPDLEALAVRCEQASGADRELDRAIVLAVFPVERIHGSAPDGSQDGWTDPKKCLPAGFNFTASVDAALTLVPDHFSGQMWFRFNEGKRHKSVAALWSHDDGGMVRSRFNNQASAATPALALCAIALRSRAPA